jgi:hypothetical protein
MSNKPKFYPLQFMGDNYTIWVQFTQYAANNQNAIILHDVNGEVFDTASVCLIDEILADDEVAIPTHNGMHSHDFLIQHGFIGNMFERKAKSGFVEIPIYKLLKTE